MKGLFDFYHTPLDEDDGRRGLIALSQTCQAMRDVCQPILFSRLEVDSIDKFRAITARDENGDKETETEEERRRRVELCGAVRYAHLSLAHRNSGTTADHLFRSSLRRWLLIDFDFLRYEESNNVWKDSLSPLRDLLSSATDLHVLTLEADLFDLVVLALLITHISSHNLLPHLTSFGLREWSARDPVDPRTPRNRYKAVSHDAIEALLPLFDNRTGLRYIHLDTARGVHPHHLDLLIGQWRRAGTRLQGLKVTVDGCAACIGSVLRELLEGDGNDGDEGLTQEMRELLFTSPTWTKVISKHLPRNPEYIVSRPRLAV